MIAPKYICYVEIATGNITSVQSAPGEWGEAMPPGGGTQVSETEKAYWLTKDDMSSLNFKNPAQFARTYHIEEDSWVNRGEPPTEYYNWTGSWTISTERLHDKIREIRNLELSFTDWTQAVDAPLSEEKKGEWRTYRQSLRDIMANLPADLDDPENVVWPTQPS